MFWRYCWHSVTRTINKNYIDWKGRNKIVSLVNEKIVYTENPREFTETIRTNHSLEGLLHNKLRSLNQNCKIDYFIVFAGQKFGSGLGEWFCLKIFHDLTVRYLL